MNETAFRVGTEAQHDYIAKLAKTAGYASIHEACAAVLGVDVASIGDKALTSGEAHRVIEALKQPRDDKPVAASDADTAKRRFLTARHLRLITTGEMAAPATLDDDAKWVLDRLARDRRVAKAFGDTDTCRTTTAGVNGSGPILLEHLLGYFKTWDALAEAFGVTVPSAKAWGTQLPASRIYEAEVKTNGYVRVPASARSG